MTSPSEITLRRVLVGHRAAVNVVDFDDKYIVSASGDRTIKVWNTSSCEFLRTLNGHKRGIACLQYRDRLIVSGSSDNSIRYAKHTTHNLIFLNTTHNLILYTSHNLTSGFFLYIFFCRQTVGHWVRCLSACARRPRGTGPMHSVRREAHRQRRIRWQDQGVGSGGGAGSESASQCFVPENISGAFIVFFSRNFLHSELISGGCFVFRSIRDAFSDCSSTNFRLWAVRTMTPFLYGIFSIIRRKKVRRICYHVSVNARCGECKGFEDLNFDYGFQHEFHLILDGI